jgi:hypothetical protein
MYIVYALCKIPIYIFYCCLDKKARGDLLEKAQRIHKLINEFSFSQYVQSTKMIFVHPKCKLIFGALLNYSLAPH